MFPIIGLVAVFGMVFGIFLLEGGHFEVLAEAAPMEFVMIFGSAIGALIVANDLPGLIRMGGGVPMVMSGPEVEEAGLSRSAGAAVSADQADEDQRHRRARSAHRKAGRERDLSEVPEDPARTTTSRTSSATRCA